MPSWGASRRNEKRVRRITTTFRVLLCLLLAGWAELGPAQQDRTKGGRMSAPGVVAGEPLVIEYSKVGGVSLGQDLHVRQSRLRMNSGDGWAVLEKHRSEADTPGAPIGTFGSQLPPEAFTRVLELARKTKLAELPPPTSADFSTTLMTITLERGSAKLTKQLSSGDIPLILQIQELLAELGRLSAALENSPVAALRTSVSWASREGAFVLTLTNIGTQNVCFGDPRLLRQDEPDHWAGVRVAEFPPERPGVTAPPLQWVRLLLAPPRQPPAAARIFLKPGERFSAPTLVWRPARRGVRHLAQGVWADYTGPREAEGCYQIRGAAFSEGLEVTP